MSIADKLPQIAEYEQKVYDAGKQAYNDEWWDSYLSGRGGSTAMMFAFWSKYMTPFFRPTRDIVIHNGQQTFYWCKCLDDIPALCKERGFSFDWSNLFQMPRMYEYSSVTHIGEQPTGSSSSLQQVFYDCNKLTDIDKLILKSDGSQTFDKTFYGCTVLENITIEGTIGESISFLWSDNLTHDSLMSIINALKDYSADTSGTTYTLTIGSTNLAKLDEDTELAVAYNKGWTVN